MVNGSQIESGIVTRPTRMARPDRRLGCADVCAAFAAMALQVDVSGGHSQVGATLPIRRSGRHDDAHEANGGRTPECPAVAQMLTWSALVIVYCVTAIQIIERLGVPTSGLVAPAAVVGVALGFGAQRLVQDLLAGFFIIAERQYGFGDLISIAIPGIPGGVVGTVEDVTLRVTKVRTANGEVIFTSNGQIVQLTNLSRDWARVVVDVPVPLSVDIGHISEILRQVGREVFADEKLSPQLLDAPSVMGVQSIEVGQIHVRIVARTLPGRQFLVGLALRGRIAAALRREGIYVPVELDTGAAGGATQ